MQCFSRSDGIIVVHSCSTLQFSRHFLLFGISRRLLTCSHLHFHHKEMVQLKETKIFRDAADSRAGAGKEHEPAVRGAWIMMGTREKVTRACLMLLSKSGPI